MEKDKWTNVALYGKDEYLTQKDFARVRGEIRTVWRSLGWIHLRMTNDIDTENKMPLNKPQLKKRIEEARDRLQKMIDNDFKEDG